jgi:hypothetical protein
MALAREGVSFVLLVGDEPYYGPLGFAKTTHGAIQFPGPVDPDARSAARSCRPDPGPAPRRPYRGLCGRKDEEGLTLAEISGAPSPTTQ